MLRQLRIKNFYSIREALELSLLLNARTPDDFRSIATTDGQKASKIMALVGANASGKTNILKTLAFIHWFITDSFVSLKPDEGIPVVAHFACEGEPTEFEVEFELDKKRWKYCLQLTSQRVLHESLHRYDYRFVYIFKRDWDATSKSYQVKLKDEFDFSQKEAQKVRANASLIATAAQYGQPLALRLVDLHVKTNLNMMGKYSFTDIEQLFNAAEFLYQQPDILQSLSQLLAEWDLGLSEVFIKEQTVTDKAGRLQTLSATPSAFALH